MTIDEARAHIGEPVVFKRGTSGPEEGTIVAVGRVWVFVQYPGDDAPVADRPGDLHLLTPEQARRRDFRASLRTGSSGE
jgi:hypothetical protein